MHIASGDKPALPSLLDMGSVKNHMYLLLICAYEAVGTAKEEMRIHLDYHLVHTEHKSSMWRQLLGQHHFRPENIADLMELIYFLWFEACQLTRAARMLAKV